MKLKNLSEMSDEEIEGSLLLLTNLINAGGYGKLTSIRKLFKFLRTQTLIEKRCPINISLVVNNFAGKTDCMVLDNHGDVKTQKEVV